MTQEHENRSLDPKALNDPLSCGPGRLANHHSVPKASPNDRDEKEWKVQDRCFYFNRFKENKSVLTYPKEIAQKMC